MGPCVERSPPAVGCGRRREATGRMTLPDGILSHLEMEHVALVGMAGDQLLVELNAEARLRRRDDIARLPADRLHEHVGMEALPALDAFEDQKVGAAGRELNV